MGNGHVAGVARGIRTLWGCGSVGGMTDGQLLARFVESRDEAGELAFAALVGRHGPMVLRVARDVLRDPHSAEDAFQATFLVLARKARSIARPEALGPWLHGVAHRIARKARVEADRRRRRESVAAVRSPRSVEPGRIGPEEVLHEEVARLPDPCRVAVVLCYFEDLTYEQAARRLGVSEATVRGRLARARRRLRGRLAARGATAWSLPIVPGRWIGPTARAASRFARGIPGEIPANVAGLAEGVLRIMALSQLKATTLLVAFHLVAVAAVFGRPRQVDGVDRPSSPTRIEATRSSPRPDEPHKPDVEPIRLPLTYDQAVDRLLRDVDLRSKFAEIPQARADILTAGLRANPVLYADSQLLPYGTYTRALPGGQTQHDVNVSYPLDLARKRKARAVLEFRVTKVTEAQYVDAARQRIDILGRSFGAALEARDLANLRGEAVERLGRLETIARDRRGDAVDLGSLQDSKLEAAREQRESSVHLDRCLRDLASRLAIPDDGSIRLEVVGDLGRASSLPSAERLSQDALATRPDLLAFRLGVERARADARLADASRFGPQPFDLFQLPAWLGTGRPRPNSSQTQVELSDLEKRILSEVKEARRENADANQALPDAKEKAVAARYAFETAWSRFEKGSKDPASVLSKAREADEAARAQVEALARNYRSRVALNTAVGRRVIQHQSDLPSSVVVP